MISVRYRYHFLVAKIIDVGTLCTYIRDFFLKRTITTDHVITNQNGNVG